MGNVVPASATAPASKPAPSDIHLCHVFASFGTGGPQVRTAAILNALPGHYRHTIVAMDRNTACRELLDDDVRFDLVEAQDGPLRMGRLVRGLKPDLLVTYNWGSMDAAIGATLRRVRPWIHTEDGFNPDEAAGQLRRRVWTRRLLLRGASALVLPSLVLERIAGTIWKMRPDAVHYIPNGVDLNRFSPGVGTAFRASLNIPEDAPLVGSVAGLRTVKNPLRLLEAFAAAAPGNAHLVFAGQGPEETALRQRIDALDVAGRVHLAGHVSDPVDCHRALDVFALSSDSEQMPLSVVEAMGCATPVVSPDVGDVRAMVAEPNRGFVPEAADEDAFRGALKELVSDAGLRERLGTANRERALRLYSKDAMIDAYRSLYERVLGIA